MGEIEFLLSGNQNTKSKSANEKLRLQVKQVFNDKNNMNFTDFLKEFNIFL